MSGPVNGIGAQQQVPFANTFKPGESSGQARPQVQGQQDSKPGVQESGDSDRSNFLKALQQSALKGSEEKSELSSDDRQDRGSVVDIAV